LPELPEVETIAVGLRAKLPGAVIAGVGLARAGYVRDPRGAAPALVGRSIAEVRRQGKRITITLRPQGALVCHLGMTGRIQVLPSSAPLAKHTHLALRLDDGALELRFHDPRRFGGVWIEEKGDPAPLSPLGPDALSLHRSAFLSLLARDRQIKALLLDQHAVSGLGNIYCDEALFASGIHPRTKARSIRRSKAILLHAALGRILRAAIRHRGSTLRDYATVEGGAGRFQSKHLVYGREGEPCVRCGAAIRRIQAAGRSSHVCLRCQRAPRA
jgi:formamidopyrimidine-DNA glycosylase